MGRGRIWLMNQLSPTLTPSDTPFVFAPSLEPVALVGAALLIAEAVAPKLVIRRQGIPLLPLIECRWGAALGQAVISGGRRATGETGHQQRGQHKSAKTFVEAQANFTSLANWRLVARLKQRFLRPYSRRAARR